MWCSTPRMPPISSPPPARPGPPWTSMGSGEPCPVDSLASSASSTSSRPCHGATPEHDLAGELRVGRDDRAGQAALPARRELDHVLGVAVRHQRADRPERLDLVRLGALGVVGAQQHRRHERAALGVGADHLDLVGVAEHHAAGGQQRLQAAADLLALLQPGERAHAHRSIGRVADRHPRQPLAGGLGDVVHQVGRDEGAADRGALLPRLDRHLRDQLLDEEVELLACPARRRGRGSSSSASRPRR